MPLFSSLTIRAKLIALVTLAVVIAQTVIASVLLWQEAHRYAEVKRDSMLSAAQVLSVGVSKAVAERNRTEIRSVMRAIGRIPGLVYVGVEDTQGRELADLGATEQLSSDLKFSAGGAERVPLFSLLTSRTAELAVPVVSGGVEVGRLRIVSDTSELPGRLRSALAATAAGALLALVLALLVALRLQRSITRPLTALTKTMAHVGARHDYSAEIEAGSNDEVGVLVRGFNTMIGDIRERDQRLAKHREQLETEVAERTQDYRLARDAAESANAAKSDFLATMSHEIRTPMNGILVMADLLAAGDLPPRSRRYAEVISRSGQGLVAIINDILDFSKIEAGKLEVEELAVDVEECVNNVVSLFGERAQSKGLDLAALIETDAPRFIVADPVRLNQVLSNLVNNALKFTETGHVTLRVARDGDSRVRFSVIDTGIGIPEDKIATIFSAFSQADQTTTRRFGGTGLGLSIAQRLVTAMGGEISVTSEAGKGSAFTFALAAANDQGSTAWPCVSAAGKPLALVCFDGDATSAALDHYLANAGYAVTHASRESLANSVAGAALIFAGVPALRSLESAAIKPHVRSIAIARLGESGYDGLIEQGLAHAGIELPLSRHDVADLLMAIRDGRALQSVASNTRKLDAFPQFPGAKVLVVDDGAVNREVAIEALRTFGIAADIACDGREAVEACARERYDLVLMDGSMPGMDGFEATRAIRSAEAAEGRSRQIILALTAHVVGSAANLWREADMDGVLHKPFTIATMADCLDQFLQTVEIKSAKEDIAQASLVVAEDDETILDPALVSQLRDMAAMGRGDFVQRVTSLYLEHGPQSVADIRSAAQAGDSDALAKAAHALKSMSFNVGARHVAQIAGQMELQAREERVCPDAAELKRLDEELERAFGELRELSKAA